MIARFFRRNPHKAAAARLYDQTVAAARRPGFYGDGGVEDSVDGRFDLIVLHASLVMRRLREGGEAGQGAAQALFDRMFDDMDAALREMGVGDTSVGKKIKKMAEAFYGRASAYDTALKSGSRDALKAALWRNVFAEASEHEAAADRLAAWAEDSGRRLDVQDPAALLAGEAPDFAPAP
ncbi:ubiquinol-cytochrome C chaperone [Glycocaulis profundi]|nr:ubiquinol-cytochrome C chaperone [Glycocaulis profundi]